MDAWVSRRRMLALSAAVILAPELLSCSKSKRKSNGNSASEEDDDPFDLSSFGYDPDEREHAKTEVPRHPGEVPPKASVNADWLPPVGHQYMGNCFVWASAYGLATFNAARNSKTPPTSRDRQAGPDYAYIRYEMAKKIAGNTCKGGQVGSFLDWLKSNGGTPSLAAAPNYANKKSDTATCSENWSKYDSHTIAPDARFVVDYKAIQLNGTDGLKNLRSVIAAGSPVAFGTHLYEDFKKYNGKPSPFVGGGKYLMENGKKAGHVMLIIGYDDSYGDNKGAVRIQNSWGNRWGDKGYAWVAYDTLEKLAEGTGFYAPESA